MAALAEAGGEKSRGTERNSALEVVLLYEDLTTALRAKGSLELVRHKFPAGPAVAIKLWRLDLLAEPLLAEQVTLEAVAADLLLLSLHDGHDLRLEVREWLRNWLKRKEARAYALALLLDPAFGVGGAAAKNFATVYLQHVALSAGAELLQVG